MRYLQQVVSLLDKLTPQQQAFSAVGLAGALLLVGIVGQVKQFQVELPTQAASKTVLAKVPSLALSELPKLHLMGKAPDNIAGMPNTILQLSLKGLYSGEEPELGSAIISTPGKTDHVYLVGDKLPGNAILAGVYSDRVVIDRNGELEVLRLVKKGLEEEA